jgi:tetratricopeptide (TPR) repeat protein
MQIGINITQREDLLKPISPEELVAAIKNPAPETAALIARLRLIHTVDVKQYGVLKRQLPYIVCGVFNPAYRKIENFGYTEYFMLDIDHIADKCKDAAYHVSNIEALKARLIQDDRIVMCFVSPSEDGLKVLFRLAKKCYDAGKYSLFYKLFLTAFSGQYGLQQVIDVRTSDVSRACFLSHDPEVFFNPAAEAIKIEDFVDFDNPFEIKQLQNEWEAAKTGRSQSLPADPPIPKGPDADALAFIKEKLFKKQATAKQKPQVYVPEQLDAILENLSKYIKDAGVVIEEIVNISYGKKFKLRAGLSQAEINLFFGKKGFSVVQSPRQGTSGQLNELMTAYIQAFISDYILLKENLALSYKPNEIKAEVPEHELIKQQAQLLFTEKNWREAWQLYQTLWENFPERCDEWDGWRYAYCAQKLEDYTRCLDICRKVYVRYRDFKMIRNVYAWSIYHSEIKKIETRSGASPFDEATFLRAGEGILKLSTQDDTFSPYTLTVMKVLDYLSEKQNYPTDKILEWTQKLNPAILDRQPFSFTGKDNKPREIASKLEQYYMLRTRALLEKGDWDECIRLCEEALKNIDNMHYDNDVWFRWRIALSYEGLQQFQKSLDLQLDLLKRKKEWFIQKEIAEQYYSLGDYGKSLQYAIDSALNFGDTAKKINTYIVLKNVLEKLGKTEEARLHAGFIEKIKRKDENLDNDSAELKKIWNVLKFSDSKQFSGVIRSILPNGKAGFVETGNKKSYYFSMRDFKANQKKAVAGMQVTFYLEEGYDAKKDRKTMNAIHIIPTSS